MLYFATSFAREHHEYPLLLYFLPINLLLATNHAFCKKDTSSRKIMHRRTVISSSPFKPWSNSIQLQVHEAIL